MSSRERAKELAREIQDTLRAMKAAEIKVKHLSQELTLALSQARAEAEAALIRVEYPTGRYECKSCGQSTLVTEPTSELAPCDNCGHCNWAGHEPTVTRFEPPPPKKFPTGMYECARCGGRTVVADDTDELSPCELCGASEYRPI